MMASPISVGLLGGQMAGQFGKAADAGAILERGLERAAPQMRAGTAAEASNSAVEFEEFFIFHVLQSMSSGLEAEAPFGGGSSERAFRSFMLEAYAEEIVASGGLGLADQVQAELVRMQAQETAGRHADGDNGHGA